MYIFINNNSIEFKVTASNEIAYKIDDAILALNYFESKKYIILGGDILNTKLEYTYDSWFYELDEAVNDIKNSGQSFNVAINYISNYIEKNGSSFYVVIVTQNQEPIF